MLTNEELRESEFPDTWDNTMLATAQVCKRKLYWFLRGLDYASKPAYFTFGSAFQEMLNVWYTADKSSDPARASWKLAAAEALAAGRAYWQADNIAESKHPNTLDQLEKLWGVYLTQYPTEPWNLVQDGAEKGWTYPIQGSPYYLGGSMDGYIEWQPYGFLCLENKTAGGYLTDGYLRQWDFSGQPTNYIWYLTQIHPEDSVYGCLMNCITKQIPGPRSKWNTPQVSRIIVQKSEHQLQEHIIKVLWAIQDVQDNWAAWYWPTTFDSLNCTGGVGKAPCLFQPLCIGSADFTKVDPLSFSGIISRKGPWEPWKREGEQD